MPDKTVEIDTLWNVKTYNHSRIVGFGVRRNRYIVECKVCYARWCSWNCKVEIDTLWNVKLFSDVIFNIFDKVEIDTLWNVKGCRICPEQKRQTSRNRYIVECKDFFINLFFKPRGVEIDTLWNVKQLHQIAFSARCS